MFGEPRRARIAGALTAAACIAIGSPAPAAERMGVLDQSVSPVRAQLEDGGRVPKMTSAVALGVPAAVHDYGTEITTVGASFVPGEN